MNAGDFEVEIKYDNQRCANSKEDHRQAILLAAVKQL